MKDRYKNLLDNLGYDTKCVGAMFFGDLIDEVYELMMGGKTYEDVINLLPSIYLENYHFDYGIGREKYFNEIEAFLESKHINKKSKIINKRFSLLNKKYSLDELVMFFSKYFYDIDKGMKKEIKIYKLI